MEGKNSKQTNTHLTCVQVSNLQKKLDREIELNQIDHYRIINENAQLVKGINEARHDLKAMRLIESGGESTTIPAPVSASDAKEVPPDTEIVNELRAQIQELQAEVAVRMERIRYLENQMYKQETIKSLPNSKSELPPLDIGTWTLWCFCGWTSNFVVEGMLLRLIVYRLIYLFFIHVYVSATWRGCQMVVASLIGFLELQKISYRVSYGVFMPLWKLFSWHFLCVIFNLSVVMDDWSLDKIPCYFLKQSLVCSATEHFCNEILSWMIETWIENHTDSDNNCNILGL